MHKEFLKLYLFPTLLLVIMIAGFLFMEHQITGLKGDLTPVPAASKPTPADTQSAPASESPPSDSPHALLIGSIEDAAGMRLSRLADLIMHEESKRATPYLDSEGKVTIGVGRSLETNGISVTELHAIVPTPDYQHILTHTHIQHGRIYIRSLQDAEKIFKTPLTDHDIALLLTDDLLNVKHEAVSVFGDAVWERIDQVRREVILDVLFNLGLPHFKEFVKFIGAVKVGNWETAANELLLSEAAQEDPERYFRNSRVIRTGNSKYLRR